VTTSGSGDVDIISTNAAKVVMKRRRFLRRVMERATGPGRLRCGLKLNHSKSDNTEAMAMGIA
jgi:hypothetical protein